MMEEGEKKGQGRGTTEARGGRRKGRPLPSYHDGLGNAAACWSASSSHAMCVCAGITQIVKTMEPRFDRTQAEQAPEGTIQVGTKRDSCRLLVVVIRRRRRLSRFLALWRYEQRVKRIM